MIPFLCVLSPPYVISAGASIASGRLGRVLRKWRYYWYMVL